MVRDGLFAKEKRDIETDRMIVDNIQEAIHILSSYGFTELQRHQCGILLAGCASPFMAKARCAEGTERRICERLQVPRGCRSAMHDLRPYRFRQAALRRVAFAEAHARFAERGPSVGDRVYVGSCGSEATLVELHEDGRCSVEFSMGEISEVREYKSTGLTNKKETRNVAGSARLRLLLPSLAPATRKTLSTSGVLTGLAELIDQHVRSRCSESPHARDLMARRIAVFLHERKQALIKTEPIEEMHEDFTKQSAEGQSCKLSTYKQYLPWNLKVATP